MINSGEKVDKVRFCFTGMKATSLSFFKNSNFPLTK